MSESDSKEPYELHQWLDRRLGPAQSRAFERRLAQDADLRASAAAYLLQAEQLRRHGDRIAAEPVPPALSDPVRGSRAGSMRPWLAAAAVAIVAWTLGWYGHRELGMPRPPEVAGDDSAPSAPAVFAGDATAPGFVRTALRAHEVFVPEVRHPVEVPANESAHLQRWLSNRLGRPIAVPDLNEDGYRLVGGRLLPCESGACAQFMYERDGGGRVTLFAARREGGGSGETGFRFGQQGSLSAFYWIDRGFGYTVSGELDRDRLFALARRVHLQLER
ncbi:MAG: anti-sigma factor [Burkholderiales bacterium]|nr:MAG: anti-sigma factor [Burkholderiales bacterium]